MHHILVNDGAETFSLTNQESKFKLNTNTYLMETRKFSLNSILLTKPILVCCKSTIGVKPSSEVDLSPFTFSLQN